MFKWFFDIGDKYASSSNWKDYALLKFCLFSMGIVVGVLLPSGAKKVAIIIASIVFVLTYIPLMIKLFKVIKEK